MSLAGSAQTLKARDLNSESGVSAPPSGDEGGASHLQHIVEGQVSEGFAAEDEGLSGLLRLVHFVPGCLCVLHLRQLHVFPHSVKLLLGVLELTYVSGGTSRVKDDENVVILTCCWCFDYKN